MLALDRGPPWPDHHHHRFALAEHLVDPLDEVLRAPDVGVDEDVAIAELDLEDVVEPSGVN
jgi:hypothetical protein